MEKQPEILVDLKNALTCKLGSNLKHLVLFGSQAWGTPRKTSDYDILVVLSGQYDWKTEREISNICYSIDLKYNILTDTHIVSEYELQNTLKGADPVFVNALKKGIYA